nr:MAG TPA: replicative helicase [Caudoviricetes sp.]
MSVYDSQAARLCLGAILIKPSFALSDKFPLTKQDFEPQIFHLRLYQAITALAKRGAQSISAMDCYTICANNAEVKRVFDDNSLADFIDTIKQIVSIDNFELYWTGVRKATLLREYAKAGFDISRFEGEPEKHGIQEILDYYDGLAINIRKQFYQDKSTRELRAGDGFEEIKERFKTEPAFGATTFSRYLNTAARGWQQGQLTMHGAVSGSGKTGVALYNAALVACPELWDDDAGCYQPNPCYQHKAALFIQYELNDQEELTPKLIGSISGVPTYHLLNGNYDDGEEERVDKAIKILHDSNIYFITMPSFTNDKLKACIKEYTTLHDVGYVVFDYVSQQSTVSSDIAKKNGVATRSDQVLSDIVSNLKDIAVENNVAILTFCQTNANVNNQEILDAGCLAGSRAMQDKLDVGGIIMPLRRQEKEVADMMIENASYQGEHPNRIVHLFKVRFGNQIQHLKIWGKLDLNTGRWTDCWCTDADNKPYDMTRTKLVYANA